MSVCVCVGGLTTMRSCFEQVSFNIAGGRRVRAGPFGKRREDKKKSNARTRREKEEEEEEEDDKTRLSKLGRSVPLP